jgi:hypothetical protein
MASSVPHETQAGCIEALQAEIALTRRMLQHESSAQGVPPRPNKDDQPT